VCCPPAATSSGAHGVPPTSAAARSQDPAGPLGLLWGTPFGSVTVPYPPSHLLFLEKIASPHLIR
jgi:hypothetical protein